MGNVLVQIATNFDRCREKETGRRSAHEAGQKQQSNAGQEFFEVQHVEAPSDAL